MSICALSGSTQSVNKVESELTTLAFRRLRAVASYQPLLNVSLSERRHNHHSSTPQSDTNETTQKNKYRIALGCTVVGVACKLAS